MLISPALSVGAKGGLQRPRPRAPGPSTSQRRATGAPALAASGGGPRARGLRARDPDFSGFADVDPHRQSGPKGAHRGPARVLLVGWALDRPEALHRGPGARRVRPGPKSTRTARPRPGFGRICRSRPSPPVGAKGGPQRPRPRAPGPSTGQRRATGAPALAAPGGGPGARGLCARGHLKERERGRERDLFGEIY